MKFLSSPLLLLFFNYVSFCCGISLPSIYIKYFKTQAIDIIEKAGPKDACSKHLKAWIGDLFNIKKLWALRMLDASAKPQTGLLAGNIMHWGHFDQCLQISEDKGKDGLVEGQYCTVALTPVKNVSSDIAQIFDFVNFVPEVMGVVEGKELKHLIKLFKPLFGLCFPKSCSADNLQKLWNYIEFTFKMPVHITIDANFCSYNGKDPFVFHYDKYVIWAFILFFLTICLATFYDVLVSHQVKGYTDGLLKEMLISFSLHKNLKSIFHYPSANSDNTFSCINGLKVLNMLWIIFGHRYVLEYITGNMNMLEYFEWRKNLVALIVLLAPFAVDTFLTISGLLLAYKYLQIRDMLPQNKSFPYLMFYFLRFIRLWPALVATILLYTSIMKYLNNGPLWPMAMYKMSLTCASTGWLTALFMTNMVEVKYQCLEPAWYLAVDTQLYCIAPVLLYFLYKSPKKATLTFLALSFMSSLYAYIVTVNRKVKWTLSEGDEHYHMMFYQSTFVRMPSWILGLLTGALIYNFQEIQIPKIPKALIWTCIIFVLFAIAKTTNKMISSPYNEYSAGIYNALARPSWSLAMSLFIFLCATGNGGIINRLLSLNIFQVTAKFSYSTYLLHIAVITLVAGDKRTSTYLTSFTTLHAFLGDLPFIFAASLVWCLAFESPFLNIVKILIQFGKGSSNAIAANDKKILYKSSYENKELVNFLADKQVKAKKNK